MRSALREPLIQFLALGLLLFLFFEWRGGGSGGSRIVVTHGELEHLASGFARTWQRPPTDEELKALVDDRVKEEIAAREAVASGLDRDDTIIRRRLRQKLEFVVEDTVEQAPPTDADLKAWLDTHADAFRSEAQVSFRQVFLSPERRGARASADAAQILARLRVAGPDADTARLGDATMLPAELPLEPVREVRLSFGEGFARGIEALAPGEWAGPVQSSYGLHLVLVRERVPASVPELASVRPEVEREVVAERRRRALEALYRRLLEKYTVEIERPASSSSTGSASATAAAGAPR
jgi:hypothetical protein